MFVVDLALDAAFVFDDPARRRKLIHTVVPEATYKRRKVHLTPAESERAERLARVIAEVRRLWQDDDDTRAFVTTPHPLLERRTVLEAAMTDPGARRVGEILAAIEFGLPV